MQGFRIFALSRQEVQGKPLIDPRKRLEFRGWCAREDWGATFVVPFLEHYSWAGSFERAWDVMVKEHDGVQSSVAGFIIATDSGEWSLWFEAARTGDLVGVTLYRKVWFEELGIYTPYPLPPVFYGRKAWLVKKLFGKEVINVELQAEPWGPVLLYDLPREEQKKTMNPERFEKVISYAKKTGLREFYFWGAEWWYWLKSKGEDEIWNEAAGIFSVE